MTMVVVLAVVALIAWYGSRVSFAPGAQPETGEIPTADVTRGFVNARATMDFAITVPQGIPQSWHPNSFSVSDPDGHSEGLTKVGNLPAVRGGWVTPDGAFVQLVEADGTPAQLLDNEFEDVIAPSGALTAGSATWQVTTGVRAEVAWVRQAGDTSLLITGNASHEDFVILAESVSAAGA